MKLIVGVLFGVLCFCLLFVHMLLKMPSIGTLHQILDTQFPCHPDSSFSSSSWYNAYAALVHSVHRVPPCEGCLLSDSKSIQVERLACSRWWHPTPQRIYLDYPLRNYSGILLPENQTTPQCDFGQLLIPETSCSSSHRPLFEALDRLRVVYFPRSGTELGIVRGSKYLSADGDLDIFVDMPQLMLYYKLRPVFYG